MAISTRIKALVAVMAITAIIVPAASAGGAPTTGSQPTVTFSNELYAVSDQTASFTDTQVATSSSVANGKEQVKFTVRNGLSKTAKASATTCLIAGSTTAPAKPGKKCDTIAIGTKFTNSGICRSTGKFCMFTDHVKAGDSFHMIGGQWFKDKCGNKVWGFPHSKSHPKGHILPAAKVQVVQDFNWTATVKVHATVRSSVSASAACFIGDSVGAVASASGSGDGYGDASASASAKTKDAAIVAARNAAQKSYYTTQHGSVKTNARASASSNMHASAQVWCKNNGSSTTTTPPAPPVTPPNTPKTTPSVKISLENVNDIPVVLKDGVPVGTCKPITITVTSTAVGILSVAPHYGAIGKVSCFDPTSQIPTATFDIAVGTNTFVVYVWAPSDSGATSDTLTATPTVSGLNAQDTKDATASEDYTISQPASGRPA